MRFISQASAWPSFPADGQNRLLAFAQALRTRGATVVFDNNYRPSLWPDIAVARDCFSRAFTVADTALITADDHQTLFGFDSLELAVAAAKDLGVFEVVIKRGAAPTLVRSGSGPWHSVPTQTVTNVVDTTAAGDSFAAGYLSRRLRGNTPEDATQFGNRLAARVIAHHGAIIPLDAMADLL